MLTFGSCSKICIEPLIFGIFGSSSAIFGMVQAIFGNLRRNFALDKQMKNVLCLNLSEFSNIALYVYVIKILRCTLSCRQVISLYLIFLQAPLRIMDYSAGPIGPVRCNRCKAYMNPFVQFVDGGRRFLCNICTYSSEGRELPI